MANFCIIGRHSSNAAGDHRSSITWADTPIKFALANRAQQHKQGRFRYSRALLEICAGCGRDALGSGHT